MRFEEAAISAAITAKEDAETQEEIDGAVGVLKAAVETFKAAQILDPDPDVKVEEVAP